MYTEDLPRSTSYNNNTKHAVAATVVTMVGRARLIWLWAPFRKLLAVAVRAITQAATGAC